MRQERVDGSTRKAAMTAGRHEHLDLAGVGPAAERVRVDAEAAASFA